MKQNYLKAPTKDNMINFKHLTWLVPYSIQISVRNCMNKILRFDVRHN